MLGGRRGGGSDAATSSTTEVPTTAAPTPPVTTQPPATAAEPAEGTLVFGRAVGSDRARHIRRRPQRYKRDAADDRSRFRRMRGTSRPTARRSCSAATARDRFEIWMMDLDGTNQHQVTQSAAPRSSQRCRPTARGSSSRAPRPDAARGRRDGHLGDQRRWHRAHPVDDDRRRRRLRDLVARRRQLAWVSRNLERPRSGR